jgi:hypothetical protein
VLPMSAFVEGKLYLSWMHFFQAHYCLYSLYSCFILLFSFFVQELTRGHFLGMVTRADSVTDKYFHRDEKVSS